MFFLVEVPRSMFCTLRLLICFYKSSKDLQQKGSCFEKVSIVKVSHPIMQRLPDEITLTFLKSTLNFYVNRWIMLIRRCIGYLIFSVQR